MSTYDETAQSPGSQVAESDAPPEPSAYSQIVSLARESASTADYYGALLRTITSYFHSPYAAIHVACSAEVVQDEWHTGPGDPKFWKAGLQQYLTQSIAEEKAQARVLRAKKGTTKVAFLSAPICDASDRVIGAVALVMAPIEPGDVAHRLATLESMAKLGSLAAEFIGSGGSQVGETVEAGTAGAASLQGASSRAAEFESAEELSFALCNELSNKLQCEQVSLGLVTGRRVKIVAVSGLDTLAHQSPGMVALRGAMEECLDAGKPIVYQNQGAWGTATHEEEYRLHKQWRAQVQGENVASIPLHTGERVSAVVSLRKGANQPFEEEQLEGVRKTMEPFAPALSLLRRADRGLTRHVADAVGGCVDVLRQPERTVSRVMAIVASVLIGVIAFGTLKHELAVPCVLTAARARHMVAPFEGVLVSVSVVAGDVVRQGQVLCEFDTEDLDYQRKQLIAEQAVLERKADQGRADGKPVDVLLAGAEHDLLAAKLGIVERRLTLASVRAPFDGVVVAGDMRTMAGAVLARGEMLFQVAPLGELVLELEVPNASAGDLRADLAGSFVMNARPGLATPYTIKRVLTQSQMRGERNVFVAQADVTGAYDWLRPGMEGIARIDMGRRPVWWILSHRAIDALRLNFWL